MGTIADLNELIAPAPEDFWVVRDVSDPLDKDKKMLLGKFPLKNGTPAAGRVARWKDATGIEDGGFDVADIARLSTLATFAVGLRTGVPTQNLGMYRLGTTIQTASWTNVLTGQVGVDVVLLQANHNATNGGGMLFMINNNGTLVITAVASANLVNAVPTGFQIGYQASGTTLQLRGGPSWGASVGVNVGLIQLTW